LAVSWETFVSSRDLCSEVWDLAICSWVLGSEVWDLAIWVEAMMAFSVKVSCVSG
jgi:hypothetical protein